MKYGVFIMSFLVVLGCSSAPETDKALVEKDKEELAKRLQSFKVTMYKFVKISVRSFAVKDTTSAEYMKHKSDFSKVHDLFLGLDSKDEELSALDYISIYSDYKKLEDYIAETDEDIFPTITEAYLTTQNAQNMQFATGDEKEYNQSMEHAVISAIAMSTKNLGSEIALYECSKIKPDALTDNEYKAVTIYYRGFLFFVKGYFYLSEDAYTKNIAWLKAHPTVALPNTSQLLNLGKELNNEQAHIAFIAMNHLFRGFDRLQMDREKDKQNALEDFEAFLKGAKEVGIDNEIVWAVETYLYLHNNDTEKAIVSLAKLKSSDLLTSREKESIADTITYLKDRDGDSMLNGAYDKFFLGKIATKYMFSVLAEIDWEKKLEEENVPHTKEMFEAIEGFQDFLENLETYTSEDKLKEVGAEVSDEIKNQGKNLWEKANELIE